MHGVKDAAGCAGRDAGLVEMEVDGNAGLYGCVPDGCPPFQRLCGRVRGPPCPSFTSSVMIGTDVDGTRIRTRCAPPEGGDQALRAWLRCPVVADFRQPILGFFKQQQQQQQRQQQQQQKRRGSEATAAATATTVVVPAAAAAAAPKDGDLDAAFSITASTATAGAAGAVLAVPAAAVAATPKDGGLDAAFSIASATAAADAAARATSGVVAAAPKDGGLGAALSVTAATAAANAAAGAAGRALAVPAAAPPKDGGLNATINTIVATVAANAAAGAAGGTPAEVPASVSRGVVATVDAGMRGPPPSGVLEVTTAETGGASPSALSAFGGPTK
ncbi:hypothetical protein TSOC_004364 [Tetrabaena socialis]|uniref:Uncharacterized protein n=1 Tax=Tetrabaena socialis TaxID=47790 RepID=A0A2J8A911_9CHLO|nr:hypothetical protein TSOC_004364 [Tetrabaena socialis]|eukprot:PNH09024.1 hypothetical protein TSOC_004364 [Tetrabaena socialis]